MLSVEQRKQQETESTSHAATMKDSIFLSITFLGGAVFYAHLILMGQFSTVPSSLTKDMLIVSGSS